MVLSASAPKQAAPAMCYRPCFCRVWTVVRSTRVAVRPSVGRPCFAQTERLLSLIRCRVGEIFFTCSSVVQEVTNNLNSREEITMQRRSIIVFGLLLIGATVLWRGHKASGQANAGWVTLFDGKNLDHWNQVGNANWRLVDGVVQADKGEGFLVTKETYGDFE